MDSDQRRQRKQQCQAFNNGYELEFPRPYVHDLAGYFDLRPAECLIKRDLFPYIPAKGKSPLSAKTRLPMIVKHLLEDIRPDIAALQEVDCDIWEDQIGPKMIEAGYDFFLTTKNPLKKQGHGLVIMWKVDRFRLYQSKSIYFDEHPLIQPTSIMPVTGNVCQLIALEKISEYGSPVGLIVTNHHLYWRPMARYTRLRQIAVLLEETSALHKSLMASDYNTTPNEPTYQLLTSEGGLDSSIEAALQPADYELETALTASNLEEKLPVQLLMQKIGNHPVLYSAYGNYQSLDPTHATSMDSPPWPGEPKFTNYSTWKGTLDYILTSFNGMASAEGDPELRSILSLPPPSALEPGLPNASFPSDHLSIVAEFSI
ncbi:RNA exonuclease ngl2 [Dinochytrium kinnereticum]|nr:RNA exonuclease ngl2 [Dinochytrium kinnereticum]